MLGTVLQPWRMTHKRKTAATAKFYLVSQDRNARHYESFTLVHWEAFLTALWNDELLD